MKKMSKFSIPAALALFVVTAHPQGANQNDPNSRSSSSQQKQVSQEQRVQQSTFDPQRVSDSDLKKAVSDVNKASTFMGMNIQNLQNEKLGSVKDIVFDPDSGKISYAVISVGGVLGVGDKLIAVPITSLRPQPGEKYLVINMNKDELQSAPGLTKNNWPNLNDPAFGAPAGAEHHRATSTSTIDKDSKGRSPTSSVGSNSSADQSSSTESSKAKESSDSSSKKDDSSSDQNKQP